MSSHHLPVQHGMFDIQDIEVVFRHLFDEPNPTTGDRIKACTRACDQASEASRLSDGIDLVGSLTVRGRKGKMQGQFPPFRPSPNERGGVAQLARAGES